MYTCGSMFSGTIRKGHLFLSSTCIHAVQCFQVQLEKGIYFVQLQEWFRVFPRDQIMILRLEDYTLQRTQTVQKIYSFLDFSKFITESRCVKTRTFILVSVQAGFKQFYSATELYTGMVARSVVCPLRQQRSRDRSSNSFIEKQFPLPLIQEVRVVSCWRKRNVHLI